MHQKKNKSVQQPRQQTPRQQIIHSATLKKQKNKIGNGLGITNENEKSYGTKPDNTPYTGKLILNVTGVKHDMNAHFRKATTITYYSGPNYPINNKFGEMHVYLDLSAPVRFVKS